MMHSGVRNFMLFVVLVVMYCMFMTLSAMVLIEVEKPFEDDWRQRMNTLKSRLNELECITSDDIEELILEVEIGQLHGFSSSGDMNNDNGWSFGASLLFATSIGTTVGYGNLAPGTVTGKVLTALLTSVSVPLTLLLTTVMVIRLLKFTRKLKAYLENKLGNSLGLFLTRFLHLFIVFTCVLSFFVFVATLVFRETEPSWNMLEALYFSIVSVSTVGLGDYVPGSQVYGGWRELYLVFCSAFLIVGVVFALLVLETLYEIPELGIHVYLLPTDEDESVSGQNDFVDRLDSDKVPNKSNPTVNSTNMMSHGDGGKATERLIGSDSSKPSYGVK